jgi:hypothetical protein
MSARQLALLVVMFTTAGVVLAAARPAPQTLAAHTLVGTVSDSTGRPLRGAIVELRLPASSDSIRTVTTGADGKYRFERIVPGLYVLTVQLPGFGSAIRDLEIGGGDEMFEFDIRLQPIPDTGTSPAPPAAGPGRRVVCGLTMITPVNPDPKMSRGSAPPPFATPFNDRLVPLPTPKPQHVPPPVNGTMRTMQPTMCWDPLPSTPAPNR